MLERIVVEMKGSDTVGIVSFEWTQLLDTLLRGINPQPYKELAA